MFATPVISLVLEAVPIPLLSTSLAANNVTRGDIPSAALTLAILPLASLLLRP